MTVQFTTSTEQIEVYTGINARIQDVMTLIDWIGNVSIFGCLSCWRDRYSKSYSTKQMIRLFFFVLGQISQIKLHRLYII